MEGSVDDGALQLAPERESNSHADTHFTVNTINNTDRSLLEASKQLPLTWLNKTPDTEQLKRRLCAAARELQGIKGEPEIARIQSDLLAVAYSNELPHIFLRGRAQEAMSALSDLTMERISNQQASPEEETSIPVKVYRRSWGEVTHIYRVEPVAPLDAQDTLRVLSGDLFEVLEPDETPGRTSSHRVIGRHLTLVGANRQAGQQAAHPRVVRLVSPAAQPLTACADNGAELVVGQSITYRPTPWEDRLRMTGAPQPLTP